MLNLMILLSFLLLMLNYIYKFFVFILDLILNIVKDYKEKNL